MVSRVLTVEKVKAQAEKVRARQPIIYDKRMTESGVVGWKNPYVLTHGAHTPGFLGDHSSRPGSPQNQSWASGMEPFSFASIV